MKKFGCALVFVLLMTMPALAAEKSFSKFKMNVADGWTAQEDAPVVSVLAPNNEAALSIVHDATDGATDAELAKAMSKELGGTEPKKEGEFFKFSFTRNGNESECLLFAKDGQFIMFTITDPSEKYGAQIQGMIESISDK